MTLTRNILRKSYFFNKIYLKTITKLINLVVLKNNKKAKALTDKKSSLHILLKPNNTFITLNSKKKLHNITAGSSGFKGPKRSSPYSRHVVARNMSYYIYVNKMAETFDLYFNSQITRRFFFFFKGLVVKPFDVRFIIRNKIAAHGQLRKKKKRRK